jgi:hypothetical protein
VVWGLKLDELITCTYLLTDANEAMRALERGEVVRSVLLMRSLVACNSQSDSGACESSWSLARRDDDEYRAIFGGGATQPAAARAARSAIDLAVTGH